MRQGPKKFHYLLTACYMAGLSLIVALGGPSSGNILLPGETITAGDLTLRLSADGRVTGLHAGDTDGVDRLAAGRSTPLVSLVVEDSPSAAVSTGTEVHYRPQSWQYTAGTADSVATSRGSYVFHFADRIRVTVEAVQKPGYATLEVTAIANPGAKDIRLVLWGPLATDISAQVGETAGVVSDRDFAMGLIGLNARTLGGWPRQYPQTGLGAGAAGGAGRSGTCRHDVAVCAALSTTFGSVLQAYTRDYSVERVFEPWSAVGEEGPLPVAPLTGEQAVHGQLVGSKVALFGMARRSTAMGDESLRDAMDTAVLERVGDIGSGEGLPHPVVSGVWDKRAEQGTAPLLVFTDLSSANLDRALTLANDLGWQTVYRAGWGAFDGGSLGVGSDFGGNDAGLQAVAQRAAARRVGLGSHSRFGAIPGSLAARHVADLLVTHYGILDVGVSDTAPSMHLRPYPGTTSGALRDAFNSASGVVRVGEELIAYGSVTPTGQGVLLAALQRGHEGTAAAVHTAGARVGLVGRPAGQAGYTAGLNLLLAELAPRLVSRLDQGISTFAFDGSAELTRGGYGALALNLVQERVWRSLTGREGFIQGADTWLPWTWRLNTHYGWSGVGEDMPAAQQYRANQVYFRRNYLPPMLGWWRLDGANEWRRALARAAAFDAGFAWYGSVAEAGTIDAALRAEIRDWRNAQLAGTFDAQARVLMQAPDADVRLDKVTRDRGTGPTWRLSDWEPSGAAGGHRRNSRYLAPQLRGFPLANLARDARVRVSGAVDNAYGGALAVDAHAGVGVVEEGEGLSGAGEWAISAAAPEKWIELAWDSPQALRRIILFDRAQTDQNVSAGTLSFTHADDSVSTLSVSGIAADGSPKVVDFAPRMVKQVRFALTATQGTAPGLAEFVALGPSRHYRDGTLALGAAVTGVAADEAARVTDGIITAGTGAFATLTGNHAVLDLGGQYYVNGLTVWHYFGDTRTYRDVVFEVADNPGFADSTIVFNNDTDNSLGLGAGQDAEDPETSAGRQVLFAPVPARYLRLWCSGNTVNDACHLTEVEVYGTGNGATDVADGGVTSGNAAAAGLDNAIDHDPATLASVGTGAQYLQVDLGREKSVNSLLVLRDNTDMRTYRGVVYQLSATADFSTGVTTVFHNDNDDLHGLGLGESTDTACQETANGHYVRFAPVSARWVRLYSAGSDVDDTNRYREVLVGTAQAGSAAPSSRRQAAETRGGNSGGLARTVTKAVPSSSRQAAETRGRNSGGLAPRVTTRQSQSGTSLRAGDLTITFNSMGRITALVGSDGNNYLASGYTPALLKLIIADSHQDAASAAVQLLPTSASLSGSTLTLSYENNLGAVVTVVQNTDYLSLELSRWLNPDGKDVRVAMWGPYELNLADQVADVAGVAYSRDFAVGIQALNVKTFGGAPYEYRFDRSGVSPDDTYGAAIGGTHVALNKYWLSAARLTTFGSVLQAYSRDYRRSRQLKKLMTETWTENTRLIPAISDSTRPAYSVRGVNGSKIALFGLQRRALEGNGLNRRQAFRRQLLAVIHRIERREGLPYTTSNGGVYSKLGDDARTKALMDRNPENDISDLVLQAGFNSQYHWSNVCGYFTHCGFRFRPKISNLRDLARNMKTKGVRLGNHYLPGFAHFAVNRAEYLDITTNLDPVDPYIKSHTRHLASRMQTTLAAVTAERVTISSRDERFKRIDYYTIDENTEPVERFGFVRIGGELISYTDTKDHGESNLRLQVPADGRGVMRTDQSNHWDGRTVDKMVVWPKYNAFAWGDDSAMLQGEALGRSIHRFGLQFVSLDGIESYWFDALGELSANIYYKSMHRALNSSKAVSGEASRLWHYNWHFHNRFMWGEHNSQLLKGTVFYQLANMVMMSRNFMPVHTGGFFAESNNTDDFEWLGAKMAAFHAGALIRAKDFDSSKAAVMKRWSQADDAGAFSDYQRARMKPWERSFQLREVDNNGSDWKLGQRWRLSDKEMNLTMNTADEYKLNDNSRVNVRSVTYGASTNPFYVARPWAGFPTRNIAGDARVEVSSKQTVAYQGDNAVDGFIGIFNPVRYHAPRHFSVSEWRARKDDSSPWIKLTWDSPQTIRAVMLSDGADPRDNVTRYAIEFEDGTRRTYGGRLPRRGVFHEIPMRDGDLMSRWIKVTILGHEGANTGLGEIAVIAEDPQFKGDLTRFATVVPPPRSSDRHPSHVDVENPDVLFDGIHSGYVDVHDFKRFIVIDLGDTYMVDGLNVWRFWNDGRSYNDLVYQLSTTEDFSSDVTTVFNNDADNSNGQGAGRDPVYRESPLGRPVYFPPVRARYVRLWSKGNSVNNANHYREVQVYGMKNLARGVTPTPQSDAYAAGAATATDGSSTGGKWHVGPSTEYRYAQLDLGSEQAIDSLRVWRDYSDTSLRRYRDVKFQLSTTSDFSSGVTTVFNNDLDNSRGQGEGEDGEYDETAAGKIVHFEPVRARYVRLYSHGSNFDNKNWYTEIMAGEGTHGRITLDLSSAPKYAIAGKSYTYEVEANHSHDSSLTFTADLADGGPLPGWLSFDPASGTFSGTPPRSDVGQRYDIRVRASARFTPVAEAFFSLYVFRLISIRRQTNTPVNEGLTDVTRVVVSSPLPDGGRLSIVEGDDDGALFEFVRPGFSREREEFYATLRFRTPPDFENPQDIDRDNVYFLNVRADNTETGDSLTIGMPVQVSDIEAPAIPGRPEVVETGLHHVVLEVPAPGADQQPVYYYHWSVRKQIAADTWSAWDEDPAYRSAGRRFRFDGLDPDTLHQARARAWNAEGSSEDWSAQVDATTRAHRGGLYIEQALSTPVLTEGYAGQTATVTAKRNHANVTVPFAWRVGVVLPTDSLVSTDVVSSGDNNLLLFGWARERDDAFDAEGFMHATGEVILRAVDDDIDYEPDPVVYVTGIGVDHPDPVLTGHVGGENPIAHNALRLNIIDDDHAGVRVSTSGMLLQEGESGAYTVELLTEPTEPVTVNTMFSLRDQPDADMGPLSVSVEPAALTFTDSDWNQPQTVTVRAGDDGNARDEEGVVNHTLTTDATEYSELVVDSLPVAVKDDDAIGVSVPSALTVTEGETALEFPVALQSQPFAPVTLTVTADSVLSVTPLTLTFTQENWSTEQPVQVQVAQDDEQALGQKLARLNYTLTSTDGEYDGLDVPATLVTVEDDDVLGLDITLPLSPVEYDDVLETDTAPLLFSVVEGDVAGEEIMVALLSEPTADVAVSLTPQDNTLLSVTLTPPHNTDLSVSLDTLNFTSENWDVPQSAVVTASHDDDAVDTFGLLMVEATGGNFEGLTTNISVLVVDDDTPAVNLPEEVEVTEGPEPGGPGQSFTVSLASEPVTNVTVAPGPVEDQETKRYAGLRHEPLNLTFTPDNWNTPQEMTLFATGADDDTDGEVLTQYFDVDGSAEYRRLAWPQMTVQVLDPDVPGISITPSFGRVLEGSGTVTFEMTLSHQPQGEVTVSQDDSIVIENNTAGRDVVLSNLAIVPSSPLKFSEENWNVPQDITISYANDDVRSAGQEMIVRLEYSAQGGGYDGITAPLTVEVVDVDAGRLILDPQRLELGEKDTGGVTYRMGLNMAPTKDVTVTVDIPAKSPVSVSPSSLTFTQTNWRTPQVVTVLPITDDNAVDELVALRHTTTSEDGDFNQLEDVQDKRALRVEIAVLDSDSPGVLLDPADNRLVLQEGDSGEYTATLQTEPTGNVTLYIEAPHAEPVSVDRDNLTFTVDNWNVPQTVAVSTLWDSDREHKTVPVKHRVEGADYTGTEVSDMDIRIRDRNSAPVLPPLEDQTIHVTRLFQYQFGEAYDLEESTLTYGASGEGDAELPEWLSFDPDMRLFAGTPGISDVGNVTIEVTVTDSDADDPKSSSDTFTVTVQTLGTLTLAVDPVAGDDTVNITERTAGFAIAGDTGTEPGVAVTVTLGGHGFAAVTSALADHDGEAATPDRARWSVAVPPGAAYVTGPTLVLAVAAAKPGHTPPTPFTRNLAVDLEAPAAPAYAAPAALAVGEPITPMAPTPAATGVSYAADGLPDGLAIDADSGLISGTPTTANAAATTATVTATDSAGNRAAAEVGFPAVARGGQDLSGFGYQPDALTFGAPAPVLAAPTVAERAELSYAAAPATVCAVDAASGALTLNGHGTCTVTVTAAPTANYEAGTRQATVTVGPAGALSLAVDPVAGDDTVNITERTAGFAIAGDTGTEPGVAVTVTLGGHGFAAVTSALADHDGEAATPDRARWSVAVPPGAAYVTGPTLALAVAAAKPGHTPPTPFTRNLAVDLEAPAAPAYAAPAALAVGEPITPMAPTPAATGVSYAADGLPDGLAIDADSGLISGTPTTANAAATTATVTATDSAGNRAAAEVGFPAVARGGQDLSGFGYQPDALTFGDTAPVLAAPTVAERAELSYAAAPGTVCAVDAASGALTLNGHGTCTVTVTAAPTANYAQGTRQATVTVSPAGALSLAVDPVAGDDTVNITERTAGFAIAGDTGTEPGVAVTVTLGGHGFAAVTSALADHDGEAATPDRARWSVAVPPGAAYVTGPTLALAVAAAKPGHTPPTPFTRNLAVDLEAPAAPAYAAPAALAVGEPITPMAPTPAATGVSYAADGLPDGLAIDADSGLISGTPTTANAAATTATVTATDSAGNRAAAEVGFPAVARGGQDLSGFGYQPDALTFGDTAPVLAAPTVAERAELSYAAAPATVCAVDAASGALTLNGHGTCTVTVTAAPTANYAQGTRQATVTVGPAGALSLAVDPVAGDDTVNITERTAGFAIAGDTGTEPGVAVTVTLGGHGFAAVTSALADHDGEAATPDRARWSVAVPPGAAYVTGPTLALAVAAAKPGHTPPTPFTRNLAVDLEAPAAPAYAAPAALAVGEPITPMAPTPAATGVSYAADGLPDGLAIDADSGLISGTPTTANAAATTATVTATDSAGNRAAAEVGFPAVARGGQDLSGFGYQPDALTFGDTAPVLAAPTVAERAELSYAAAPATVCAVDAASGALTLNGHGTCTVTVTAAPTANYAQGTRQATVTVSPAGALSLAVDPVAGDDTVNITERTAGFAIAGDTGTEPGVAVTVTLGGHGFAAVTSALADHDGEAATPDRARWSVAVPPGAAYVTGPTLALAVAAAKPGHTPPTPFTRNLAVDLEAPAAPAYAAPAALAVGEPITPMAPTPAATGVSYAADGLPDGLAIDADSGLISGTPTTANAAATTATVTATDSAGNRAAAEVGFPAVARGGQDLSGFGYQPDALTFGDTAPVLAAPTVAERAELSYAAAPGTVCAVDAASGALTLNGHGTCTVTVTAAPTANYEAGTRQATVTVGPAGALSLAVDPVAGDDTVNITERTAGFAIAGDTGTEPGVAVTVTLGGHGFAAVTSALADHDGEAATPDRARWSVAVPPGAAYVTGPTLALAVAAAKPGHTPPTPFTRNLAVDLEAPAAPAYAAPAALAVGEPITPMAPTPAATGVSYAADGLPDGLAIDADSGLISGTPTTANAAATTATVTATDSAGNRAAAEVGFPAVARGGQDLSGFGYQPDALTFGDTAPVLAAPTVAERAELSYAAAPATVCAVDAASGALTLNGHGTCTVTVTAAPTANYAQGTRQATVTVSPAGALSLAVDPVAGDDTVNITERTAGFAIAGDTGTDPGVAVTVTLGGHGFAAVTSALADHDGEAATPDRARWSVAVPPGAAYVTGPTLVLAVAAAKPGHTPPTPFTRNLAVDLEAPAAPAYAAPAALAVGEPITPMAPTPAATGVSYAADGLPDGLAIDADSGLISGTPTTANAAATTATVTATDSAGNRAAAEVGFPAVARGGQDLSGFGYQPDALTFGDTAPVLAAPTVAERAELSYAAAPGTVCAVDAASGALTLNGHGTCTVTVTAAPTANYAQGTRQATVTVSPAGALSLAVDPVAGDDTVNITERTAGFAIAGDTGTEPGVAVTVTLGGHGFAAVTSALADHDGEAATPDRARWSVAVPPGAAYVTGPTLALAVAAAKPGHTAPPTIVRILTVDDTQATPLRDTDDEALRVISILRQSPLSSPTNADSLTWRVDFNRAVEQVTADDFGVTGTTALVTVAEISELVYHVTVSGGDLAGVDTTVTLSFNSAQDIIDAEDNSLVHTTPTTTNDNTYVVDNTAPSVNYTPLLTMTVGEPITPMTPTTPDTDIVSYAADGLPDGLAIDADNGLISGTPVRHTGAGATATVTVTDAAGNRATTTLTLPRVEAAEITVMINGEAFVIYIIELPAYVSVTAMAVPAPVMQAQTPPPDTVFSSPPVELAGIGMLTGDRVGFCLPRGNVPDGRVAELYTAGTNDGSDPSHWSAPANQLDDPGYAWACAWVSDFSIFRVGYNGQDASPRLLSVADASAREGNKAGVLVFPVRLSAPSAQEVTVTYATRAGSARPGADYEDTSGTLRFGAGETAQRIEVPLLDDVVAEQDETFTLVLANPVNAGLARAAATGVITDDDMPVLYLRHAGAYEGDGAVVFRMELAPWSEDAVTVDYTTADGSAVADTDYRETRGTLTFRPGQTMNTLRVPLIDDAVHEDREFFMVNFSNLDNAEFGRLKAVNGWIHDNDVRAILVAPQPLQVDEGATAYYTVALATQPVGEVTVTVTTDADGVQLAPMRLRFDAHNWDTAQTVTVRAPADADMFDADRMLLHTASGGDYDGMQVSSGLTVRDANQPPDTLPDEAPMDRPAVPR